MQTTETQALQDLKTYQSAIRFPPALERDFRRDFGERQPPMLRTFFGLGLILYMSFAILDYWALPIYYPTAWAIRLVTGTAMLWILLQTRTDFFKRNVVWIPSVWTMLAGISIQLMIYIARPYESAYIFYALGLLLIIVAIYIPSSGDYLYPSTAGWITVIMYIVVAIFRQNMLASPGLTRTLFVISFFLVSMNILCMIGGYMLVVSQRRDFLQRRAIEQQRGIEEDLRAQAEDLLLNVLPPSVAERLKRGEVIADVYDQASVLFADIVNFTPFSSRLVLLELLDVLNEVFSHFDVLAGNHDLERIKTTGDGYLIAAGVPVPRPDHAEVLTHLGIEMCDYFSRQTFAGQKLGLRVGISSGPVVAAVVGFHRFSYDVWGDTVNTASRMESHGRSGMVQITEATYRLVRDKFRCDHGGRIEVKGKGQMNVWHVIGPT